MSRSLGLDTVSKVQCWVFAKILLIAGYTEIWKLLELDNILFSCFCSSTYNVITCEQGSLVGVVMRNLQEHHTACDGWEAEKCYDWALHLPNSC